jgi:hypothetical protein
LGVVASLIQSCKLNVIYPEAYLADAMEKIVKAIPTFALTNSCPGGPTPPQLFNNVA